MALFGSTKGYKEYMKEREDVAIEGLTKKLKKEIEKRQGAEKEVERLKKEIKRLNSIMSTFTGGSPTH